MGIFMDRRRRRNLQRTDNADRRGRIAKARQFIYGRMKRLIRSKAVEDLLKEHSEVPTEVRRFPFHTDLDTYILHRMHSHSSCRNSVSITSTCL